MKFLPESQWPIRPIERPLPLSVRLSVNALSLLTGVMALIGWVGGLSGLRIAGVVGFALIGLGAGPMSLIDQISTLSFFCSSLALSMIIFVLIGFAMVESNLWAPEPAFLALAIGCCVLHVASLNRHRVALKHD